MYALALAAAILLSPNPKVHLKRADWDLSQLPEPRCYKADTGEAMPCGKEGEPKIARTNWHAKATYLLEATDDQKGVALAAPVEKGRYLTVAVDGDPVKDLKKEQLAQTGSDGQAQDPAPALTWKVSLTKGKPLKLVLEYDFGADPTDGLYAGSHYPDGQVLWFDTRSQSQARYDPAMPFPGEVLRQNLSAASSFGAPAPETVHVRVGVPKGLSVLSLVPNASGLDCVDANALHFLWKNGAPDGDLVVTYPTGRDGTRFGGKTAFTAAYEYEAWNALLSVLRDAPGEAEKHRVPLACDLKEQLGAALPKYAAEGCVPKCPD